MQADRYLDKRKADPKLPVDDKWDDAVKSLLNYPDVVKKMSADLDWTSALGEAVVADQGAVLDAIQSFRRRAQAAGNLKSDGKQVVTAQQEVITIAPADPQVIYVPQYSPATVVVAGAPAYGYYPTPYPSYYYPYPPGAALAAGVIWGAAIGAAWSGNHYGTNYSGNANINVNRNTNINTGNINTGNVNRAGRQVRRRRAAARPGSPTSSPARSAARSARPPVGAGGRCGRRRWVGSRRGGARIGQPAAGGGARRPSASLPAAARAGAVSGGDASAATARDGKPRWTVPAARRAAVRWASGASPMSSGAVHVRRRAAVLRARCRAAAAAARAAVVVVAGAVAAAVADGRSTLMRTIPFTSKARHHP